MADGRLVHVKGTGVQDLESKRPVAAETLFRIASMTKAFTALSVLKLRDDGKLRLDAPAENYVPEMQRVANAHRRFAEDPRSRAASGTVPASSPTTRRAIGRRRCPRTSSPRCCAKAWPSPGRRPRRWNTRPRLRAARPHRRQRLGTGLRGLDQRTLLAAAGGDRHPATMSRQHRRNNAPSAIAEEDDAWARWAPNSPWAPGVFGAISGLETNATDYAKWVACLFSAWPRATASTADRCGARACANWRKGGDYPRCGCGRAPAALARVGRAGACGMGMDVAVDCELGLTLSHGGGYRGYRSRVLLLPDYGVGLFALSNRTSPGRVRRVERGDRVAAGRGAEAATGRLVVGARGVPTARSVAMYSAGDVATACKGLLAMNFLVDRDAEAWARELAAAQDPGSRVRHVVADRPRWCPVGRFHLAVRGRPRARVGAAGADGHARIQALGLSRAQP